LEHEPGRDGSILEGSPPCPPSKSPTMSGDLRSKKVSDPLSRHDVRIKGLRSNVSRFENELKVLDC
jgi:hypothetical protein